MYALIKNARESDWYDWDDSNKSRIHFIAKHSRYYEQYVLAGGDIKHWVALSDNTERLSDINNYRETAESDDLMFWWPKMPNGTETSERIIESIKLRREYAVILKYVNCNTKHPNVDIEDVMNVICKYHVYSALNVDSIIANAGRLENNINNIPSQLDPEVVTTIQYSSRTQIVLTLTSHFIDNDKITTIIPRFTKGTLLEKEGEMITKYGHRGTLSMYNNVTLKLLLGLPFECGINNDAIMNILDVALQNPSDYQTKIRHRNIERLTYYAKSLPYDVTIPDISDRDTVSGLTYDQIFNMLPCYLVPYDENGKVCYYISNEIISKSNEVKLGMIVSCAYTISRYISSQPMTFMDAIVKLPGTGYVRVVERRE